MISLRCGSRFRRSCRRKQLSSSRRRLGLQWSHCPPRVRVQPAAGRARSAQRARGSRWRRRHHLVHPRHPEFSRLAQLPPPRPPPMDRGLLDSSTRRRFLLAVPPGLTLRALIAVPRVLYLALPLQRFKISRRLPMWPGGVSVCKPQPPAQSVRSNSICLACKFRLDHVLRAAAELFRILGWGCLTRIRALRWAPPAPHSRPARGGQWRGRKAAKVRTRVLVEARTA